jgi:mono/diheme cytochrome c family protein
MRRPIMVLGVRSAALAAALAGAACGTQRISVPSSQAALHRGAVLFQQRCAGCHSLSYAATFGSAANVFTAEFNNGPNFNIRCERPEIRVLYAIENGGFSGAIMPQNIVVGRDATEVAKFVATYAGRQAPKLPGTVPCKDRSLGSIPSAPAGVTTSTSTSATTASASAGGSGGGKSTTAGGKKSAAKKSGGKSAPHHPKSKRP